MTVNPNNDSVAEKMYTLSILQQNEVIAKLKKLELNSLQARSLTYIDLNPGTMQRNVATYLSKKQATITNILKGLQERKLIYREIPKENERQKNIFLTSEGEHTVSQINRIFNQLDEKVCSGLTQEEQIWLKNSLIKIEKSLKEH